MPHPHTAPSRRPAIGTWRLHPGHAMTLRPKQTAVLRIFCGQVWATRGQPAGATPHTAGDHFLGPGDVLTVPAGMRLVLEPVVARGDTAPVHFDWSDAPAATNPARFDREVLQPTRELGAALGQAAVAMVRVLRGLLGYREFLVAGRGRVLTPLESLRS
ncbi:MAG: DUF2917 domain-containing protein [Hydrogenophaga sp.]|uniref:DUF2917 domain-containing protein n=1 Tax=Hydrogenophaga sp. TaxID=1904254 RepID=UPI0027524B27|nr:DUF2917 domain-containing protein [Hydrogenophaga sp.]MDP2416251.1 DUF2917 domain-containing protein [Hydrogenophaga sp.]MDZ4189130.1 DUF2917 domain-containing protein [Hydrogenophaga sp.]